jgi:hypothetical protein
VSHNPNDEPTEALLNRLHADNTPRRASVRTTRRQVEQGRLLE